jgi:hypothetical protein
MAELKRQQGQEQGQTEILRYAQNDIFKQEKRAES